MLHRGYLLSLITLTPFFNAVPVLSQPLIWEPTQIKMTIEGMLDDWTDLEFLEVPQLNQANSKSKVRIRIRYDQKFAYFAIQVPDKNIVTSEHKSKGDKVHIGLATKHAPKPFWAAIVSLGDLVEIPAKLNMVYGSSKNTKVGFRPHSNGYDLEIKIPLDNLKSFDTHPFTFRTAISVFDADDLETELSTPAYVYGTAELSQVSAYGPMDFGDAMGAILDLADAMQITGGIQPISADLGGDARHERVIVSGPRIGLSGFNDRDYFIIEVPEPDHALDIKIEMHRVLPVPHQQLFLWYSIEKPFLNQTQGQRFLQIYHYIGDGFRSIYFQEIANWNQKGDKIEMSVTWQESKGLNKPAGTIFNKITPSKSMTPKNYVDVDQNHAADYYSILLPWTEPTDRMFKFRVNQFLIEHQSHKP